MLCSRFVISVLTIILLTSTLIASSVKAKSIVLNKAVITDFFDGVSIEINKPIVVSNKAGLFEVSGEIDLTDPYQAIEDVANKTNLIWYDNGSAIYIYASSELKSEFIQIDTEYDFEQVVKFLKLSDLYSTTYPLRYTKGAGYVSGPPMYVNVVKNAVSAYYNGLAADVKPEEPLPVEIIKMYPLRNRFVTDMRYYIRGKEKIVEGALTILRRLISERADAPKNINIVADTLNNALYVKGMAKEVNDLASLINEIDIIREQIQLSLWIIDVDSSEIKEIGTSLEGKISSDIFSIGLNGGSVILNQSEKLSFVGAVNLLENERKAKVLSRPVLITQNNTPAVIDTNETIYVRLIGEQEVSLKEITYGTILSVTPRVVKGPSGNDIEMMVEIEDGNQTADLIDGIPNIRRSVISTVGRINDSQSLLLGGFVRKEVTNQNRGIPVLKDIPIIKYLFSMDVENTSSVMRLFMIEPKIIDDPIAEFNRSRIINLQSEPFFQQKSTKAVITDNQFSEPQMLVEEQNIQNIPATASKPSGTKRIVRPVNQQQVVAPLPPNTKRVVPSSATSHLQRREQLRKNNQDIINRNQVRSNSTNTRKMQATPARRLVRPKVRMVQPQTKQTEILPQSQNRMQLRNRIRRIDAARQPTK